MIHRLKTPIVILVLVSSMILALNCFAQKSVSLKVSNDMTYFSDRYFSNGIALQVYNPVFKKLPFGFLLLPHNSQNPAHWSLSFTHHIYTPTETYTTDLEKLDHPYASYLLFGLKKESFNPSRQLHTTSEFSIGWIGPLSGGGIFQNSMHAHISIAEYVEGWHYQVANDFCLQYNAMVEKGIFHVDWLETMVFMGGRFGSPHTDARIGAHFRTGLFKNYFSDKDLFNGEKLQVWLFCSGNAQLIYYDATLQGGLNNRDNPHTLQSISPQVWHLAFGGVLQYQSIKIELAQEVDSPRFQGMGWHRWAYLACAIRL